MLPLSDDNRDRLRWPVVTALLVLVNVVVFLYELSLQEQGGPYAVAEFILRWGVVPSHFSVTTILTSMFLHGGWMHLIGNMLYLWVFGDNVEDRLGRAAFLFFYFAAGAAAALAQVAAAPASGIPMVGASGAISGVLGAYLIMFPRKRVRVLLFLFVTDVPAFVVIGFWAVLQALSSYGALAGERLVEGGVAYMAHLGGFVAGVIGALALRALGPRRART